MKSLVAFYSRTGNTRIVAEALAGALGADIEAIVSDTQGKGMSQLGTADIAQNSRENRSP